MKIKVTQGGVKYTIETKQEDFTAQETLDLFISMMKAMTYSERTIEKALSEAAPKADEESFNNAIDTARKISEEQFIFDEETFIHKTGQDEEGSCSWHNPQEEEFKVGDEVEVVNIKPIDEGKIKIGERYTIIKINETGNFLIETNTLKVDWWVFPEQLKKVNKDE